jgi:hypothetical protein
MEFIFYIILTILVCFFVCTCFCFFSPPSSTFRGLTQVRKLNEYKWGYIVSLLLFSSAWAVMLHSLIVDDYVSLKYLAFLLSCGAVIMLTAVGILNCSKIAWGSLIFTGGTIYLLVRFTGFPMIPVAQDIVIIITTINATYLILNWNKITPDKGFREHKNKFDQTYCENEISISYYNFVRLHEEGKCSLKRDNFDMVDHYNNRSFDGHPLRQYYGLITYLIFVGFGWACVSYSWWFFIPGFLLSFFHLFTVDTFFEKYYLREALTNKQFYDTQVLNQNRFFEINKNDAKNYLKN